MQKLIFLLFRFVGALPLPLLHAVGNFIGTLAYHTQPKLRARIRDNIQSAGIITDNAQADILIKSVCQETMKGGLELAVAWTQPSANCVALFKEAHGMEHIQQAVVEGKGLLLITPHLGSYDLAGRYISDKLPFPLTAMYRPPKIKALNEVMNAGRQRDNGRTAPTNMQGVKQVIKALRSGEATIVLPDQVPSGGDGIWAHFFQQEAYTMTLAAKLAHVKNVTTLFFCGERLHNGQGFVLHVAPLDGEITGEIEHDVQIINENVEAWVRRFPEQYLFSYNRYKCPAGAPPKPSEITKSKSNK